MSLYTEFTQARLRNLKEDATEICNILWGLGGFSIRDIQELRDTAEKLRRTAGFIDQLADRKENAHEHVA